MPGVPVRLTEIERRYFDAGNDQEYREVLRGLGVAAPPLSAYLRAGALERTERILGLSLADFEAKERRRAGEK
jgi:hypothetical protein